jgi:glycopeptide antibiotics resistance protein
MFSWAKIKCFKFFLHCRFCTKKLLDSKVKKKKCGKYFFGLKIVFFRASYFGFIVKGVCLLLLPLVYLAFTITKPQFHYIKNISYFLE